MADTGSSGGQNFEQTVRNPVDLERYADTLTVSQRQLPEGEAWPIRQGVGF
jgi:hypothetical protein